MSILFQGIFSFKELGVNFFISELQFEVFCILLETKLSVLSMGKDLYDFCCAQIIDFFKELNVKS